MRYLILILTFVTLFSCEKETIYPYPCLDGDCDAEFIIDKEKEVIENAYNSGQESNWSKDMGLMGDWYYNETFNTKDNG